MSDEEAASNLALPPLSSAYRIFSSFVSAITGTHIGVSSVSTSDQREAYFNGSVYIRLAQPMTLWRHSALSFRTCRGEFYEYFY